MKTLLALVAATVAIFTFGSASAQAGDSPSRGDHRYHSDCGNCKRPVYSYYRPVRYTNAGLVYGWMPYYHGRCRGVSPNYIYHYGYGGFPSRYSPFRSMRDFDFFRTYPTSRGRFGYGFAY